MHRSLACLTVFLVFTLLTSEVGCSRTPPSGPPSPRLVPVSDLRSSTSGPGLYHYVTEPLGIRFVHSNGTRPTYSMIETFGGGCAFLDYDGDGFLDIVLLSCGEPSDLTGSGSVKLALYHNEKGVRFTDVTAGSGLDIPIGYGQGVSVGDYDNDGAPDLYVTCYGRSYLFHNCGTGSASIGGAASSSGPLFEDVTGRAGVADRERGPRWAAGAAWGDYDNDGKLDLYVCHYAVWSPATDKKCPRPDGSPSYCGPLVYEGDTGTLYHNEGGGRFKDVTRATGVDKASGRGLTAAWMDYDGDGRQDLYVANDRNPNLLFHNEGGGRFIERGVEAGVALGPDGINPSGMGIGLGDYDHSGRESLFVPNLHGEAFSLYHNEGKGIFTYATDRSGLRGPTLALTGWGAAFLDIDRDGWLDIVAATGHVDPAVDAPGVHYELPLGIYRNAGKGVFEDFTDRGGDAAAPHSRRGLATGDFDNDGRVDVLCVNRNARADLLRNVSPDKNHWLTLRLIGTKSNRDGAGARVTVRCGGEAHEAVCRLSSSYASSNDKRLHFGLGAAAQADVIEVQWPSGVRSKFTGVAGDARYAVTESGGITRDP